MKKLTQEDIDKQEVRITIEDVKNAVKQASSTVKEFIKAKLTND
jgi:hypothetical protein